MRRRLGFVVLAHENIFRVRQVIRFLAEQGAPVVVHLDSRLGHARQKMLRYDLEDLEHVYFIQPRACYWGDWSLVDATLDAVAELLERHPKLHYVMNLSGSCLPIKTLEEMETRLDQDNKYPTDYIESHLVGVTRWTKDGLEEERFTLWHPFKWKLHPRLFNFSVELQRFLHVKRKLPDDLSFALGSQWWCLSRPTLERILHDPKFGEYKEFFRKTWIPDESFFQSMARKHSPRINGMLWTYVRFNHLATPFLFYDDHRAMIMNLDYFFIRKISPRAGELYAHFLNPLRIKLQKKSKRPHKEENLDAYLDEELRRTQAGQKGLVSQFTISAKRHEIITVNSYTVYIGFESVQEALAKRNEDNPDIAQHGYLYHPARVDIYDPRAKDKGRAVFLRDYVPEQFLMEFIWKVQPRFLHFFARPHHLERIQNGLRQDPNAVLYVLYGAWIPELAKRNIENISRFVSLCRIEIEREARMEKILRVSYNTRATIKTARIGDFLKDPSCLAPEFETLSPKYNPTEIETFLNRAYANGVHLADYGLATFLDSLRKDTIETLPKNAKIVSFSKSK